MLNRLHKSRVKKICCWTKKEVKIGMMNHFAHATLGLDMRYVHFLCFCVGESIPLHCNTQQLGRIADLSALNYRDCSKHLTRNLPAVWIQYTDSVCLWKENPSVEIVQRKKPRLYLRNQQIFGRGFSNSFLDWPLESEVTAQDSRRRGPDTKQGRRILLISTEIFIAQRIKSHRMTQYCRSGINA